MLNKLPEDYQRRLLGYGYQPISLSKQDQSLDRLKALGLDKATDSNKAVSLPLPSWLGTYEEVLKDAVEFSGRDVLDRLAAFATYSLPELPTVRPRARPGWQRYRKDYWRDSSYPEGSTSVLDFEAVKVPGTDIWLPTCCVVLALDGLYVWQADFDNLGRTIEFSADNVLIGHNVPYDRQYLACEYRDSQNRFFDTMAAFMAVRGMSNQQRPVYKADLGIAWASETSTLGLDAIYSFYTGQELDKGVRDCIVDLGLPWVQNNMSDVVWYCIKDVFSTAKVFQHIWPEWLESQQYEVTQTAHILLGSCLVPLSADRWPGYYDRAEAAYKEVTGQVSDGLEAALADVFADKVQPLVNLLRPLSAKKQPEVWAETVKGYVQGLSKQLQGLDWSASTQGPTKGQPKWYRDLTAKARKGGLTATIRDIPLVLGCRYLGEPLLFQADSEGHRGWYTDAYGYLPHPKEAGQKVTNLFCKDHVGYLEDGTISADYGLSAIAALASGINWKQMRQRMASLHVETVDGQPWAVPQMTVSGTATCRATDPVFQVLAKPKATRIGTEFKSLIEAPKGQILVGADWDAQEMWIASLYADRDLGFCGSSPLAVSVLLGNPKDGTDAHSKVSTALDVDRDSVAKILNFGALYGQGLSGSTDVIHRAKPKEGREAAERSAQGFLDLFKGKRSRLDWKWYDGIASEAFNQMDLTLADKTPRSPLAKAALTKPLAVSTDYKTTKTNWTIQRSGVDARDMMVVLVRYLCHRLGIFCRLVLTIHDEYRFRTYETQAKDLAYVLQLAHLLTVAAFIDAFGLDCIPAGAAYFSQVDVDRYLRKSPDKPEITPSQPEALPFGYGLSVEDLLDIALG